MKVITYYVCSLIEVERPKIFGFFVEEICRHGSFPVVAPIDPNI
jgi:hypothetical protein